MVEKSVDLMAVWLVVKTAASTAGEMESYLVGLRVAWTVLKMVE